MMIYLIIVSLCGDCGDAIFEGFLVSDSFEFLKKGGEHESLGVFRMAKIPFLSFSFVVLVLFHPPMFCSD